MKTADAAFVFHGKKKKHRCIVFVRIHHTHTHTTHTNIREPRKTHTAHSISVSNTHVYYIDISIREKTTLFPIEHFRFFSFIHCTPSIDKFNEGTTKYLVVQIAK